MNRRALFPFRPDSVRVSSGDEFEETMRIAREARAKLRDPRATVAVVVCRVLEGDSGVSLQAALAGGCEATRDRIVESAAGYLADFIRREVAGRIPS